MCRVSKSHQRSMKRVTFAFELGRAAVFCVSRKISRANRACTHNVQTYTRAYHCSVFAQNSTLHYFSRHLAAIKMLVVKARDKHGWILASCSSARWVRVKIYVYDKLEKGRKGEREKEEGGLSDRARAQHYARAKESIWRSGGLTCASVMRVKPAAFNVYRREMWRKSWR